mgnify:CR=1 FL=1
MFLWFLDYLKRKSKSSNFLFQKPPAFQQEAFDFFTCKDFLISFTDGRVVLKDSSPWQLVVRSPHCVRDDNLFLHLPATCHCEPQRGEAISLQATLVFGLLRYARNDKKPRWPRCTRPLSITTLHLPQASCHCDGVKRQKQSHRQQIATLRSRCQPWNCHCEAWKAEAISLQFPAQVL